MTMEITTEMQAKIDRLNELGFINMELRDSEDDSPINPNAFSVKFAGDIDTEQALDYLIELAEELQPLTNAAWT